LNTESAAYYDMRQLSKLTRDEQLQTRIEANHQLLENYRNQETNTINIILDDGTDFPEHYDPDMGILFEKLGFSHQLWLGLSMFSSYDQAPDEIKNHCS
jgi:hypothetical protein